MANKILTGLENAHKPLNKLLIKSGWELRLQKRKKNIQFNKLSNAQKKEVKDYWKQFNIKINTDWVAYFYTMSGIYDYKYIPESLYYAEIQPYLNDQSIGWALSDKNISSQIFNGKMPKTIVRKINNQYLTREYELISLEEAIDRIYAEGTVILKPAQGTYGGAGILFWSKNDDLTILKNHLSNADDLIVQEVIKQHPNVARYHESSLNTIRIVTLRIRNRTVVLNAILRMGVNNSKVDNYSAGGIIANLDEEGNLFAENIQSDGKILTNHPNSDITFENQSIINYNEIIENVITQHNRVPYFRLVSWDYAIDESGEPILIEGNYPSGQLDLHQLNKGSLFGEYTDEILTEVYLR